MPKPPVKQPGFTIVELLIIIVVIGILAAITIVAYSGIQRSARNAQTASAIEAYKKGLMAYAVINGAYPNYSWKCLGQGYPGGTCWEGSTSESVGLSTALKTVMGNTLPLAGVGGNGLGPMFVSNTDALKLDGVLTAFIFYTIDTTGDTNPKCPVGPIVKSSDYPNYLTSTPVGLTSDNNMCIMPLPNPR